jgi:hypothetical protein
MHVDEFPCARLHAHILCCDNATVMGHIKQKYMDRYLFINTLMRDICGI